MFTVQGPHSSALFIGGVDKEANEAAKGKTEKFPQVAKLGTGSDLPYRMAVHPGGDGVICSLPKSCRCFEWDTVQSTDGKKRGLKPSDKVIDELEDVGQQLALIFNNDGSVLALGGEETPHQATFLAENRGSAVPSSETPGNALQS
ncbi:hypothetical protein RHSIM_Rhsim03G0186000 [Rhododendron simsii]|uniref:Uncharacterized protein n=1 Tax=Rhododendron simsii TaxID=118357 RepID=A0A834LPI2_RHOSS|nr:hypothetical protein RHSIM_Rhsim03G0186000 [Rhododendron simsii]